MNEKLFVYGTLRDDDVQMKVIGHLVVGAPDTLVGFEKSTIFINGTMYPILIQKDDSQIEGAILSVTPEELSEIDEYETDAYRRVKVNLQSGKESWVYVK